MPRKRLTKADLEAENARLRARIAGLLAGAAVFARVEAALPRSDEMSGFVAARAEVALLLAAQLDGINRTKPSEWRGSPPNVSAIAKELRTCLDSLEAEFDDVGAAGFFDGVDVSSSVGDS